MKKLFAIIALALPLLSSAESLVWDDPNPPGYVTAYHLYKKDGTNWTRFATTATNRWPISLQPGLYTVAVTAAVGERESGKSNPLEFLQILAIVNVRIEASVPVNP